MKNDNVNVNKHLLQNKVTFNDGRSQNFKVSMKQIKYSA